MWDRKLLRLKNACKKLKSSGFYHIFFSNVINKIIGFASSIILVRLITKEEYGVYTYAYNILALILLLSGLGTVSGVLQLACENQEKKEKAKAIYQYGSYEGVKINIILSLFILFIAIFVPLPFENTNKFLFLMSFLPTVYIIIDFQKTYLRIFGENKRYSILNSTDTLHIFLFSIVGALLFQGSGLIIFRYMASAATILLAVKSFGIPLRSDNSKLAREVIIPFWKISIISFLNNGISQMLFLLDIFVLGLMSINEEMIASYKIATIIPTALLFIPAAVITYVYPYFAKNRENGEWLKKNYSRLLIIMGVVNFFITIFLIIGAPLIIKIIFGVQYSDAVVPFRILAVSYFFSGTFRVISGNILVTQRKLKFNFILTFLSGLINIAGNVILIERFGSLGAAITTLVVVIVSGMASTIYLSQLFHEKVQK